MIDVIGAVVGCASAGALVWFLERVVFKEKLVVNRKALLEAIEAKKAILERERKGLASFDNRQVIDKELMKLADEKAKI